jgi:hypothetical protein
LLRSGRTFQSRNVPQLVSRTPTISLMPASPICYWRTSAHSFLWPVRSGDRLNYLFPNSRRSRTHPGHRNRPPILTVPSTPWMRPFSPTASKYMVNDRKCKNPCRASLQRYVPPRCTKKTEHRCQPHQAAFVAPHHSHNSCRWRKPKVFLILTFSLFGTALANGCLLREAKSRVKKSSDGTD